MMPIEDLVLSASARQEAEKSVCRLIQSWRSSCAEHHPIEEFRYVHMARKGVRRGQCRDRCWVVLIVGRDMDDPLFQQVKSAGRQFWSGSSVQASTSNTASASWRGNT